MQPSAALQNAGLPIEQYQYDPVHNRTASLHQPGVWRYDSNHSLLERGAGSQSWTYQTNANGLRTEQQGPAGTLVYRYSAAERLIGLERNGQTIALYGHDPFNRRIVKNANGTLTWFVYSDEGLIAEIDSEGNTTRTYGWQPNGLWGTDPVFLANVSNGASANRAIAKSARSKNAATWAIHSYHNDHLGTPQRLTDAQGRLTWKAISESFGFADVFTGSRGTVQGADPAIAIVNPLRFPGQYFDPEVGTHYNFHRDYEPQTGRYVQTDPIGLAGDINSYVYVGSSPSLWFDHRGLFTSAVDYQLMHHFYYGGGRHFTIPASKCGGYTAEGGVAGIIDQLQLDIDRRARLLAGTNSSGEFALQGGQMNYFDPGVIYSFGDGKEKYDFRCSYNADCKCATVSCKGTIGRRDEYKDPIDLHQSYGVGDSPWDASANVGGFPFTFSIVCDHDYSTTQCK